MTFNNKTHVLTNNTLLSFLPWSDLCKSSLTASLQPMRIRRDRPSIHAILKPCITFLACLTSMRAAAAAAASAARTYPQFPASHRLMSPRGFCSPEVDIAPVESPAECCSHVHVTRNQPGKPILDPQQEADASAGSPAAETTTPGIMYWLMKASKGSVFTFTYMYGTAVRMLVVAESKPVVALGLVVQGHQTQPAQHTQFW